MPAGQITRVFSMSSANKQYRIAVIPGDGIGKEVMPEGLRVIEAAAKKHAPGLMLVTDLSNRQLAVL